MYEKNLTVFQIWTALLKFYILLIYDNYEAKKNFYNTANKNFKLSL